MEQQLQQIVAWLHAGPAFAAVDTRMLVGLSFVGFNAFRIFLHVPQLLTCLRDPHGCCIAWIKRRRARVTPLFYLWPRRARAQCAREALPSRSLPR
jgi:hypothetical protein